MPISRTCRLSLFILVFAGLCAGKPPAIFFPDPASLPPAPASPSPTPTPAPTPESPETAPPKTVPPPQVEPQPPPAPVNPPPVKPPLEQPMPPTEPTPAIAHPTPQQDTALPAVIPQPLTPPPDSAVTSPPDTATVPTVPPDSAVTSPPDTATVPTVPPAPRPDYITLLNTSADTLVLNTDSAGSPGPVLPPGAELALHAQSSHQFWIAALPRPSIQTSLKWSVDSMGFEDPAKLIIGEHWDSTFSLRTQRIIAPQWKLQLLPGSVPLGVRRLPAPGDSAPLPGAGLPPGLHRFQFKPTKDVFVWRAGEFAIAVDSNITTPSELVVNCSLEVIANPLTLVYSLRIHPISAQTKLRLVSPVSHYRLELLQGDNQGLAMEFLNVPRERDLTLSPGENYTMRLSKPGFNPHTVSLIAPDRDSVMEVHGPLPMDPRSLALKSLLLPGWGQAYSARPGAALFWRVLVGATGALTAVELYNASRFRADFQDANTAYLNERDPLRREEQRLARETALNKWNTHRTAFFWLAGSFALSWSFNAADPFFFSIGPHDPVNMQTLRSSP